MTKFVRQSEMFQKAVRRGLPGRRQLAITAGARQARSSGGTKHRPTSSGRRTSTRWSIPALRSRTFGACARPGDAWRFSHDRSHLARRLDSGGQPGRQVAHGAGVKPADFNSYGARRGNHEVMVRGTLRQHPSAESARARNRGRLDHPHPERREDVHLRCFGASIRPKACR